MHARISSVRTDLSSHGQTLRVSDGRQLLVPQPLYGVLIVPQVQFGAHQDDGCVGAVVSHLGVPLEHRNTQSCVASALHAVLSDTTENELHLPLHGRSQRTPGSPMKSILKTHPVEKTEKVLFLYICNLSSITPLNEIQYLFPTHFDELIPQIESVSLEHVTLSH